MDNIDPYYTIKPWGFILLILIICWPLGIYHLFRRLTVNKSKHEKTQLKFKIAGWSFIVLFCLTAITSGIFFIQNPYATSNTQIISRFICSFAFFVCGLILLITAHRKQQGEI